MMTLMPKVQAVQWKENCCLLLDQRKLPGKEVYLTCSRYSEVVEGISQMVVRGAPAIGVAGAYGVVLAMQEALTLPSPQEQTAFFGKALNEIRLARPTAVNLTWAVDEMQQTAQRDLDQPTSATLEHLLQKARQIHEEDIENNRKIAQFGADLFTSPGAVLTYCNTGDLATGGIGTAFGVIHAAYRQKRVEHVYACETRPVLQGIRLTAWELQQNKIPFTVICDNMAAGVVRSRNIKGIITGADRIAANGDAANKVGTYGLAVLAKHHNIPFYVAAPISTFDLSLESGESIPIEERSPEEILSVLGTNRGPEPVGVYNPSFDVTPATLITAIICERGVILEPDTLKVKTLLGGTPSRESSRSAPNFPSTSPGT